MTAGFFLTFINKKKNRHQVKDAMYRNGTAPPHSGPRFRILPDTRACPDISHQRDL
jgi:hypothetical protein